MFIFTYPRLSSMPKFCPECGIPLQYSNAVICPSCGAKTAISLEEWQEIRNPLAAIVFSFLFAGWGQWYNGKTWDGLTFFGAFWIALLFTVTVFVMASMQAYGILGVGILFVASIGIWIYGIYDAYKTAERINRRKDDFSGKSKLFLLPVLLWLLAILFILVAGSFFRMNPTVILDTYVKTPFLC